MSHLAQGMAGCFTSAGYYMCGFSCARISAPFRLPGEHSQMSNPISDVTADQTIDFSWALGSGAFTVGSILFRSYEIASLFASE